MAKMVFIISDARHRCKQPCHQGACDVCEGVTEVTCRCGSLTKEMPCEVALTYTGMSTVTRYQARRLWWQVTGSTCQFYTYVCHFNVKYAKGIVVTYQRCFVNKKVCNGVTINFIMKG